MARLVTSIGPISDAIPNTLLTFDAGFETDPNALTSGRFGPQGYPWLYDNFPYPVAGAGNYPTQMQAKDNTWQPVTQVPQPRGDQLNINGELQYYCTNELLDEFGIPRLNRVVNGVLEMHAIQTPDALKDIAMVSTDLFGDFEITSVNEGAREITVRGLKYKRWSPSVGGQYERGHYTGFARYYRDELDSDAGSLDGFWKRRKYPYGWVRLQVDNNRQFDAKIRYDQVVDETAIDPPLYDPLIYQAGSVPENDRADLNSGNRYIALGPSGTAEAGQVWDVQIVNTHKTKTQMDAAYWNDSSLLLRLSQTNADTRHRIRIMPGELSSADWQRMRDNRSVLKLFNRQPWIAQMETTGGTFAQKYFICDAVLKLHDHAEQFFALWFWGTYLNMFKASSSDPIEFLKFEDEWTNATELDGVEAPGGTRYLRRYHNIHAAGRGGMLNYANTNGIAQEMPENSSQLPQNRNNWEWENAYQAGHIIGIQEGELGNVNYDQKFNLRVDWVPPNCPENPRPVSVVRWYIGQEGQALRYLCGVIAPPWWDNNPGAPKRIFLNNAVGGHFVNSNRYIYDTNGGSADYSPSIVNYVYSLKVYQRAGYEAGGAGYPDKNKLFSRGMLQTPGDQTGGSGTGIVQADGTGEGLPGGGTGGTGGGGTGGGGTGGGGTGGGVVTLPESEAFEDNVALRLDHEPLIDARAGMKIPLRGRVTANFRGHGIGLSYGTDGSVPGMSVEGNVATFSQDVPVAVYKDALYAQANETGPPGTQKPVGLSLLNRTGTIGTPTTPVVTPPGGEPTTANSNIARIAASSDDAEQRADGTVSLTSTDLELVDDLGNQLIGLRFPAFGLPANATITNAFVQFTADEISTGDTNLRLRAGAGTSLGAFVSSANSLSAAAKLPGNITWTPAAWTSVGQQGVEQRTADLSLILQQIVAQSGWDETSAVVLYIDGTGKRVAKSYDGSAGEAPELTVEWAVPTPDPDPDPEPDPDPPPPTSTVPTVTVLNTGPIVLAQTTLIPQGRQAIIAIGAGEYRSGVVQSDGRVTISGIPAELNGQRLRVYVSTGGDPDTPADGGRFFYTA